MSARADSGNGPTMQAFYAESGNQLGYEVPDSPQSSPREDITEDITDHKGDHNVNTPSRDKVVGRLSGFHIQSSPLRGQAEEITFVDDDDDEDEDGDEDMEADPEEDDISEFGEPEGHDDLIHDEDLIMRPESLKNVPSMFIDDGDDDSEAPRPPRKTQAAFHERAIVAAYKAAIRQTYDESNLFFIKDVPPPASLRPRVPGVTIGAVGRMIKGPSNITAYARREVDELDSDDELIMDLKHRGYNDQHIADHLKKEGRSQYDRKSIATRIQRIKWAQATRTDELLLEGFKEWQIEDDFLLLQAAELAEAEVQADIEKVYAWRFSKVADWMRKLNRDATFSAKACRERYSGLMDGTAAIPTELDDDPMKRRQELQEYQEIRERKRDAEFQKAQVEAKRKADFALKAKQRSTERAARVAAARAEKEVAKAERAMHRAAQTQIRLAKAQENKIKKAEAHRKARLETQAARIPDIRNPSAPLKAVRTERLMQVDQNTPDPRSYLSIVDLKTLCDKRGLYNEGRTKAEFVNRLRDADNAHNLEQLKNMCRAKGLNVAGNKIQLRYQLAQQEAIAFASYHRNLSIAEQYNDEATDGDADAEDGGGIDED